MRLSHIQPVNQCSACDMYADYFGLKEACFCITPDPQYLYLSQRHREALAHLLYGAGSNGGFVQLTGEVGTGKTTICRAFMEQIPEQVDLALILNPALTVVELLQTICQEFHLPPAQNETSRMILVDNLNRYLLKAHANGRRPVLMIDEAQNLSPEVLEQLRLLTNLETSKHKLLQIFLVGQPELQEMLQRQELRQLAQRITARYHLTQLNQAESTNYIRHRLAVAGVERHIFTRSALHRIHKYSKGVPRVINMLCDRALLGAFATHRHTVDSAIVKQAATELNGNQLFENKSRPWLWWLLLILVLACALIIWQDQAIMPRETAANRIVQIPDIQAPSQTPTNETIKPAVTDTKAIPIEPEVSMSATESIENLLMDKHTAFDRLLRLWKFGLRKKAAINLAHGDPCKTVMPLGLRCHQLRGTWNNIRHYQRPTLLQLKTAAGIAYVLITGLHRQTAQLQVNDRKYEAPLSQLEPYWFGDFMFLWQLPPSGDTLIGNRSSSASVQWLRQQLANAGYADGDQSLAEKIKAFQLAENLEADAIAGPETLIRLNIRAGSPAIPRLRLEP